MQISSQTSQSTVARIGKLLPTGESAGTVMSVSSVTSPS